MPGASRRTAAYRWLSAAGDSRQSIRLWQIALCVLGGNLSLHQLPVLPRQSTVFVIVVLALLALRRRPLIAVAALAFCWSAWVAHAGLQSRWPAESDGEDVALIGWIDGIPAADAGRTVFSLRVAEAATDVPLRRVRLSWYEPAPDLSAGQALEIEARLKSPRGLVNPGGYDYERWLFLERFDATGYVRSGSADSDRRFGPSQSWLEFRSALVERLGRLIEGRDAAVLIQALALGERGGFEDRHWSTLQRTGTSHLVAVSGLHIGMIAAFFFLITLKSALYFPYAIARHAHALAAVSSFAAAALYAALAGFALPTRRALVMLFVIQLLVVARRRWPLGSGLALASIVVLFVDPLSSLTASFWLSFGAVALLLASSCNLQRPTLRNTPGTQLSSVSFLRFQFALTLGLAPIVVWFFGQFSLVSFVVNLIAIPIFTFLVVPLSLLTAVIAATGADVPFVAGLSGAMTDLVWRSLESIASSRVAAFEIPRPPLIVLWLALLAIAMSMTRHRLPGRWLALLGLIPLVMDQNFRPQRGYMRATVLDVGHGLAVAIETATHRVLYDAGPAYRSGFDAGAEIVVPALVTQGQSSLDLVIVSHGDSDHVGGMDAVLERFPSARVVAGPNVDRPSISRCIAGQSWTLDEVRFDVLHPAVGDRLSENDGSCVVSVTAKSGRLLLTGDIERRGEALVANDSRIASDVVVVPHHGSLTSSTVEFVDAVNPRLAIVSAGYKNRWGFPRPEVRERWEGVGASLLVTGDHGAVDVSFGPNGIEAKALRGLRRRYWQAEPGSVSGAIDLSAL